MSKTNFQNRRKRIFDFALALLIAPFVAVLCMALVLIIILADGFPAIFAQRRCGQNGTPFTLYKLRTMRVGTPDRATHLSQQNDVTALGRILRRTKADELPQLWNVLAGQMSFVGPRPCLLDQSTLINARERLGVNALKPGITGPSQVAGIDMSDPERLAAADGAYLSNWSAANDLRIMMQTIRGSGRGDPIEAGNADR